MHASPVCTAAPRPVSADSLPTLAADLEVSTARRVAARFERRYQLEPGAALGVAWLGARAGADEWRRAGPGARAGAYLYRGAYLAALRAFVAGELGGSRFGRARRAEMAPLVDEPAARAAGDPDAHLDVAAALAPLDARTARVLWLIDGLGLEHADAAALVGLRSRPWVSKLRADALRVLRQELAA